MLLTSALVGCAYGIAHGLAPDHCTALATLLLRGHDRRAKVAASLRFGIGHAVVLGALAGVAAISGWLVPPAWERGADGVTGFLLALLGVLTIVRARQVVVHRHDEGWHAHVASSPAHHASLLGGLFALGGVRALTLALAPLLAAGGTPEGALVFVVGFGGGVTLAMLAFGAIFELGSRRWGGRPDLAVGAVSVLVGGWWLIASVA